MKKYLGIILALVISLPLAATAFASDAPAVAQNTTIFASYPPALFMKVDNPDLPFADIRVRQALAMAINNQEIKEMYYSGNAEVLAWPIMPTPCLLYTSPSPRD